MFWEGAGLLLEPGGRWMLLSPGCPDTASLDGSSPSSMKQEEQGSQEALRKLRKQTQVKRNSSG